VNLSLVPDMCVNSQFVTVKLGYHDIAYRPEQWTKEEVSRDPRPTEIPRSA
jgi:hypothetical protein